MARISCPTGGKDPGDGSFCETCGVYSHSALARKRPQSTAAGPQRAQKSIGRTVKVVLAAVFALAFLASMVRRTTTSAERSQKARAARTSAVQEASKAARPRRVETTRASPIQAQAAANRRLDEALKASPPPTEPDPKEERRRKKRLARTGLGL